VAPIMYFRRTSGTCTPYRKPFSNSINDESSASVLHHMSGCSPVWRTWFAEWHRVSSSVHAHTVSSNPVDLWDQSEYLGLWFDSLCSSSMKPTLYTLVDMETMLQGRTFWRLHCSMRQKQLQQPEMVFPAIYRILLNSRSLLQMLPTTCPVL
jgi:hypothetical protein